MLAWLLRLLVLFLIAAAAGWWWWSARLGWSLGTRALVLPLILLPHMPVLALEFVLLAIFGNPSPAPRPGLFAIVRAWAGEVWWSVLTFGWRQPFRVDAVPDHVPRDARRRGVVLVHGFVCNRGLWNPWMAALRARGIPFAAVTLTPVLGAIDSYAPLIEAAVQRLAAATGQPPLIVGHSMGGLAARAWLRDHAGAKRCAGIVTIGTPHNGTWLARFAFSRNGRQMKQGSNWLTALNEGPGAAVVPFDCYYSNCDNIVFPACTATRPGASNRHLGGRGHIHMLGCPELFEDVLMRLAPPASDVRPAAAGGAE